MTAGECVQQQQVDDNGSLDHDTQCREGGFTEAAVAKRESLLGAQHPGPVGVKIKCASRVGTHGR